MERPWPFAPKPAHALPPPWYRRKALWAAAIATAAIAGRFVFLSSGDDDAPAAVTTTTTTIVVSCIDVANPSLLITIDATAASAVAVVDGWFVAKSNGATWYTTADPTRDAEGELVPMNDQARTDSESRRDVRPGDPLYNGHTDIEPAAAAARDCART